MTRHDIIEYLIVGVGVGLAVVLIDRVAGSTSLITQLIAILIAGVLLACLQLVFVVWSQMRQQRQPSKPNRSFSLRGRRSAPASLFLRELNRGWMGLEERSTDEATSAGTKKQESASGLEHPDS